MFFVITDNLVDIIFLIVLVVILYIYKVRGFRRCRFRKPTNIYFLAQIIILVVLGPLAYILSLAVEKSSADTGLFEFSSVRFSVLIKLSNMSILRCP